MSDKFDSLKGIEKERFQIKDDRKIERLVSLSDDLFKKFKDGSMIINFDNKLGLDSNKDVYEKIFLDASSKLKQGDFDTEELTAFIYIKNGIPKMYDREGRIWGMLTGVYLDLLTGWYRKEGKEMNYYFDGHGLNFDYLFSDVRNIDNLIIDNLDSSGLLIFAGSFGGKIGSVQVFNSKVSSFVEDFSYEGNAGLLSIINCEGENRPFDIRLNGSVNCLFASNLKGDSIGNGLCLGYGSKIKIISNSPGFNYDTINTFFSPKGIAVHDHLKIKVSGYGKPTLTNDDLSNHLYIIGFPVLERLGIKQDQDFESSFEAEKMFKGLKITPDLYRLGEISDNVTKNPSFDVRETAREIMDAYKSLESKGVFR